MAGEVTGKIHHRKAGTYPTEEFTLVVPIQCLIPRYPYVRNAVRPVGMAAISALSHSWPFDRRNSTSVGFRRSQERSSCPTEEFTLVVPISSLIRYMSVSYVTTFARLGAVGVLCESAMNGLLTVI